MDHLYVPDILECFISEGKRTKICPDDLYKSILEWLLIKEYETSKDILIKINKLCEYLLKVISSEDVISSHMSHVYPDILSIIISKSFKVIEFPNECNVPIEDPFLGLKDDIYLFRGLFWRNLTDLATNIARKCSPKEGYIIFVEVILGTVSLPASIEADKHPKEFRDNESLFLTSDRDRLQKFYRFLGLSCALHCIARMKRNRAQFVTTVCSLALRRLICDTECTISKCVCLNNDDLNSFKSCVTMRMTCIHYIVSHVIKILNSCLENSEYDAEYKGQHDTGSCINVSSQSVTQSTIYAFLCRILEVVILLDIKDISIGVSDYKQMAEDELIESYLSKSMHHLNILSDPLSKNSLKSVFDLQDCEYPNANFAKNKFRCKCQIKHDWMDDIYQLCLNISQIAPVTILVTLRNMPICIFDTKTQPGDLDVTPMTLACLAYSIFVILTKSKPKLLQNICPVILISLPLRLNIIYRSISIFLTYSDPGNKINDIQIKSRKPEDFHLNINDPILSYFSMYIQREKLIQCTNLVLSEIYERLQERAYYWIIDSAPILIECSVQYPDMFTTINGCDWHPNIVIKQILLSLTRSRYNLPNIKDIQTKYCINQDFNRSLDAKFTMNENLYSYIFDIFTNTLTHSYPWNIVFKLYFDIMSEYKISSPLSSALIVGILSKLKLLWWKQLTNILDSEEKLLLTSDKLAEQVSLLKKYLALFFDFLFKSSITEYHDFVDSIDCALIVLNLIKLILLLKKNLRVEGTNKSAVIIEIVRCLEDEIKISKKLDLTVKYLNILEQKLDSDEVSPYSSRNSQLNQVSIILFLVNDIEKLMNL
ncbi:uncharacterized protein CMU_017150 [Cryptosporidium muris RN66]|uniref:Uncharacterized protein n=1 Tax=Cryptosporidium muris (strain RN66) TaxID=441375 RepID=B6ACV9_CRYMR|nr:uncharacterized protein CMU_017150 [Cryptosporidium muris RN66]EEA05963.1 hypothetical protein, conserved [Cryptosporidium muris RN66]|eukprot:XP_002140312.1 hypothetical protein [Cryptosporidium muris RN66]